MRDHLRDYCTAAFIFFAKNGKSSAKYKARLVNDILYNRHRNEGLSKNINKPTEMEALHYQKIWDEKHAEINDMEAIERTIAIIEKMSNGQSILKAIKYVYFDSESSNIKNRIHVAEIHIPASEKSIRKWLKQARTLFALERGLRGA